MVNIQRNINSNTKQKIKTNLIKTNFWSHVFFKLLAEVFLAGFKCPFHLHL